MPLSYTQQVWFDRVKSEIISSFASVDVSALLLSYKTVCVVSVEAEQGRTSGAWMPRSFSITWPDLLSPVICHLNQACLNLVEVRSGTGAGTHPPVPTAHHLLRNPGADHTALLWWEMLALYPSLEWLSLSALRNALPPEEEVWALLPEMLQGG